MQASLFSLSEKDKPSHARSGTWEGYIADFFGASSVASALGIRSGATPGGPRCQQATSLPRQSVVAVGLHDPTLLAGCRDGHLRSALRTLGERHDLLAKLGIAGLCSQSRQGLLDIRAPLYAGLPPPAPEAPQ